MIGAAIASSAPYGYYGGGPYYGYGYPGQATAMVMRRPIMVTATVRAGLSAILWPYRPYYGHRYGYYRPYSPL